LKNNSNKESAIAWFPSAVALFHYSDYKKGEPIQFVIGSPLYLLL